MYEAGGRPSPAKFRSRLVRIQEAAYTGRILAERWNPKKIGKIILGKLFFEIL